MHGLEALRRCLSARGPSGRILPDGLQTVDALQTVSLVTYSHQIQPACPFWRQSEGDFDVEPIWNSFRQSGLALPSQRPQRHLQAKNSFETDGNIANSL